MKRKNHARTLDHARSNLKSAANALSAQTPSTKSLENAAQDLDRAASLLSQAADHRDTHPSDAVIIRSAQAQAREALDRVEKTHEELQHAYTDRGQAPRPREIQDLLGTGTREASQSAASAIDTLAYGGRNTTQSPAMRAATNPANLGLTAILLTAGGFALALDSKALLLTVAAIMALANFALTWKAFLQADTLTDHAINIHNTLAAACIPLAAGSIIAAGASPRSAALTAAILITATTATWTAARLRLLR